MKLTTLFLASTLLMLPQAAFAQTQNIKDKIMNLIQQDAKMVQTKNGAIATYSNSAHPIPHCYFCMAILAVPANGQMLCNN